MILAAGLAVGLVVAAGATVTASASQAAASGASPAFVLASSTTSPGPLAKAVRTAQTGAVEELVEAREVAAAADATMVAAETLATDIQVSGLDIGTATITVDTSALEAAAERLENADVLPAPLIPDLTEDVAELAAAVENTVAGLRGSLDAAKAVKAEQDAATQREAEAAAAAEADAAAAAESADSPAASDSSSVGSPSPVYAGAGTSAGDAQAIARGMIGGYGWGDDQFGCLVALWDRESGWNSQAHNTSSGAYGIPQALPGSKMASAGADWQTNAATQISWGLGYISGRYGSPCGAWSHSESVGWY